jgi:hypothetical protein
LGPMLSYSHAAKVLVMAATGSTHQNAKWRLHNNHTIERAVIDQLGPLSDGENDGIQVKKNL